ncbi:DUF1189 family protein [Haloplasma contractile]|uniref:DUF1189 domain-containing protein n=1 Tax=Haloplasma contractile SSD-17B TaxID=1033810 RepID=U2EEK1_9MOLU|nr:DUF1189 family protein [Haloplasma contractile]ERJ13398.1 hypothetical protein HLPCO_000049 [Haloplasma contractile SSD-17B]
MTEKLKDLLFRPRELRKLKDSKLYKAFLYLFIIALFSSIIPIIDIIKFEGFDVYDKELFEQVSGLNFEASNELPDCNIYDYKLTCKNQDEPQLFSLGKLEEPYIPVQYNLVIDEHSTFNDLADDELYLIFKNDKLVLNMGRQAYRLEYESYKSVFESVDFKEISEANNSSEQLFALLISIVNEIYQSNKGIFDSITISFLYLVNYVITIFQVLFYSFILFIFLIPYKVKFIHVFKVTTYAITLGAILSLIFRLFGFVGLSSTVMMLTTFIYVSRALRTMPPIRRG